MDPINILLIASVIIIFLIILIKREPGKRIAFGWMSVRDYDSGMLILKKLLKEGDVIISTSEIYDDYRNVKLLIECLEDIPMNYYRRITVFVKAGLKEIRLEHEFDDHSLLADAPSGMYHNPREFGEHLEQILFDFSMLRSRGLSVVIGPHRIGKSEHLEKKIQICKEFCDKKMADGIGLSETSPGQLMRALGVLKNNQNNVLKFLETEYSITKRFAEDELFELCSLHKITFLAYSPLDRGFWTNKYDKNNVDKIDDFLKLFDMWKGDRIKINLEERKVFEDYALRYGYELSEVALMWVLLQKKIHDLEILPLFGSENPEHVKDNLYSYASYENLIEEEIMELEGIVNRSRFDIGKRYL